MDDSKLEKSKYWHDRFLILGTILSLFIFYKFVGFEFTVIVGIGAILVYLYKFSRNTKQ